MKRLLLTLAVITVSMAACTTMKSGTIGSEGLSQLGGVWELNYVSGPRIAFNGLYPAAKPFIEFNTREKKFSGNTSCNSFSGSLVADDALINFSEPFIMTKMACPGEGEATFVENLKKVNTYSIGSDTTLYFMMGDIVIMRFNKKAQ
ncbi:MAG: META domain-containing protein [Pedobacter sp.]|nr:MAG: META domain-containing protein [Pedobacter sp.]